MTRKITILVIGLLVSFMTTQAQTFLNGSFETNTATGCNYNLSNTDFNNLMSNVNAFSVNYEQLDILTSDCYGNPQDGNWCVGLACASSYSAYDAMAIELSEPLINGNTYQMTFYSYFNSSTIGNAHLKIGSSTANNAFGDEIYSVASGNPDTWVEQIFVFTASSNANFITVQVDISDPAVWYQVDNFSIESALNIETLQQKEISIYPNPTNGILNFNFTNNNIQQIKISDLTGKTIFERVNIQQNETIDLSKFERGIYIIKIQTDNEIFTTKIVKE